MISSQRVPDQFRVRDAYGVHVAGVEQPSASGRVRAVFSPATSQTLTTVAEGGPDDVDAAVRAARSVAPAWRQSSWQERATVLHTVADRLAADAEAWAWLDVQDAGIPIRGMRRDVANSVTYLRYFAGLCAELSGSSVDVGTAGLSMSIREPYGVVGRIVPFNHPKRLTPK